MLFNTSAIIKQWIVLHHILLQGAESHIFFSCFHQYQCRRCPKRGCWEWGWAPLMPQIICSNYPSKHIECNSKISAPMVVYKSVKSCTRTFPWLQTVHVVTEQSVRVEPGFTDESSTWPGKQACSRNYTFEYSAWFLHFLKAGWLHLHHLRCCCKYSGATFWIIDKLV